MPIAPPPQLSELLSVVAERAASVTVCCRTVVARAAARFTSRFREFASLALAVFGSVMLG